MTRDDVRLDTVRVEYPRVLLWVSVLTVLLSFLTWLEEPEAPAMLHVADVLTAALLAVLGLVLLRAPVPDRARPWIFTGGATTLVLTLAYQVHLEQKPIGLVYIAIALTALGPTILFWVPFLASSVVCLTAVWLVVIGWEPGHPAEWLLVSLAALLVGVVLLRTRLRSIEALAAANELVRQLAVTDELTGLLNRHGLQAQLARVLALAQRAEEPVFALFIDIDGLKVANDRHGHAFGDEVIEAASRAVLASVRGGDLVARWGGDELVVVGIGHHPDPADFSHRLDQHVTATGVDRAWWPGHLSVGFAEAEASTASVDDLIELADADMYGRRGAR